MAKMALFNANIKPQHTHTETYMHGMYSGHAILNPLITTMTSVHLFYLLLSY